MRKFGYYNELRRFQENERIKRADKIVFYVALVMLTVLLVTNLAGK